MTTIGTFPITHPHHPGHLAMLSTDQIVLLAVLMRQWHSDYNDNIDSPGWMRMPDIPGADSARAMQNLLAFGWAERREHDSVGLRFRITPQGRAALIGDIIRIHGELMIQLHLAKPGLYDLQVALAESRAAKDSFERAYEREHQRASDLAQEARYAKARVADLEAALEAARAEVSK